MQSSFDLLGFRTIFFLIFRGEIKNVEENMLTDMIVEKIYSPPLRVTYTPKGLFRDERIPTGVIDLLCEC